MKTITYFIILAFIAISCSSSEKEITISNLRCEYVENPLGMDVVSPRFSWNLISEKRGVIQSAYRILVSDDPSNLDNENGNIWDSGKQTSDVNVNIAFDGTPLMTGTTYYWSVSSWDQDGNQSPWSEPAFFHTGMFNKDDWRAGWITTGDTSLAAPLLRKDFSVEKSIRKAFAYVSALGYYEMYLNGRKVGDHVLDPGMTDYNKRILYSTYDVTDILKKGGNAAGAVLGNGAVNLKLVRDRYSWVSRLGARPRMAPSFFMQLEIEFNDGTTRTVVTDSSWKSSASPITFNNIYGGEDYDARLEKEGWSEPGFNMSGWEQVKTIKAPAGIMQSQLMPPMRVTATLQPVAETNPSDGVYLFDMGQNYAGWWRVKVEGEEGAKIRIRGAETLNDSVFPEPLGDGDRLSIKQKYHSNVWTDYTLKGKGTEIYEPGFFYTGVRYIEVTTNEPARVRISGVEGRVVGTDLEVNGKFVSSDSLLNRINRATLWAQKGNTHSYPTDCPHREKGGYTGDGQVVAEASMHDFQMGAFYTKWLNDMRDAQQENGRIPNTSPTLVGGMGGGVAWGSAYILIPWWMYQYYDDSGILLEHYENMKDYLGYLKNLAKIDSDPKEDYIINDFDGYWYSLGEWCAPGQSDCPNHHMVNTSYYYLNSAILSKIASVLGEESDAVAYSALADTIKNRINEKFLNRETLNYATEDTYQTYQLLALAAGIVPEELRNGVLETVINDIVKTRNGHLNTGIIGTKYLWPVLAHAGKSDLAYSVLKKTTYPGFGYWIEKGSTTLIESWEGKNSHNHQMFGSVDEYFYKYLAGIRSPEDGGTARAYKQIHIHPYIPEGLTFVNASVNTVAGRIGSEWNQTQGSLNLKVVVPANSSAVVSIPLSGFENASVTESGNKIWEDNKYVPGTPGITSGSLEGNVLNFKTGSGTYKFTVSD